MCKIFVDKKIYICYIRATKENKRTGQRPERKIKMKTGYQIYVKGMNKNGTRSKKFKNAGLLNWFWNEQDAVDRMNMLVDTWKDYGFEYKIVKCK